MKVSKIYLENVTKIKYIKITTIVFYIIIFYHYNITNLFIPKIIKKIKIEVTTMLNNLNMLPIFPSYNLYLYITSINSSL